MRMQPIATDVAWSLQWRIYGGAMGRSPPPVGGPEIFLNVSKNKSSDRVKSQMGDADHRRACTATILAEGRWRPNPTSYSNLQYIRE